MPIIKKTTPAKSQGATDKVKKELEKIRPHLQMDGGDVKLVSFDEKTGLAKVKLQGACAHCPMSQITLQSMIAEQLKKNVKGFKDIEAI